MLKIKNKDVQKYQLMHEKVKHYGQGRFWKYTYNCLQDKCYSQIIPIIVRT